MKTNMAIIFLTSILFLSFTSCEALAFRCGSSLISEGYSKIQVMETCGHPTSKEKLCENHQEYTTTNRHGKVKHVKKCSRKLETWIYNCGENDFIYKLTFDDGKVIHITDDGRGRGKSDCRGK
jgi:hypothetical protein